MTNRRDFMRFSGATMLAMSTPSWSQNAPQQLPTRPVPGTDKQMAIVGLGNSSAFRSGDREVASNVLEPYLSHGGNYVDVGGSSAAFVGQLGREMGKTEQLFLGNYVDPGETTAMRNYVIDMARVQGKPSLDLAHTRDLDGFRSQHAVYADLKEDGLVNLIGVARSGYRSFDAISRLVDEGLVDFIQVNYSMMEPEAGERLLPLAMDKAVGVAISRPFLNGNYFQITRGIDLPEWAAEFDCDSWAQFSLKYILSHPAVNCVLTETTNPAHALDNISAGFGLLPDPPMRKRMFEHMQAIINA
jgi:aryl-alcohol dehydrogenase-like predicted oxidoreductase